MCDDDRLFDIETVPEVPLFREPRARKGAARGSSLDARFTNDYPPEWEKCQRCTVDGTIGLPSRAYVATGAEVIHRGKVYVAGGLILADAGDDWATMFNLEKAGQVVIERPDRVKCPECLGMGSLKARVRLEAGHRCVRCKHPYMPKGDAKMLGVERSGMHSCAGPCEGNGQVWLGSQPYGSPGESYAPCPDCKATGKVWTPWSSCDRLCTHGGPLRWMDGDRLVEEPKGTRLVAGMDIVPRFKQVEAEWMILTVHHLDGDKANCRWWNLASLCQRCHLEIQAKVVMERVYVHEHSEWFKPYVSGYYAAVYLDEPDLSREEVVARMPELLALERAA